MSPFDHVDDGLTNYGRGRKRRRHFDKSFHAILNVLKSWLLVSVRESCHLLPHRPLGAWHLCGKVVENLGDERVRDPRLVLLVRHADADEAVSAHVAMAHVLVLLHALPRRQRSPFGQNLTLAEFGYYPRYYTLTSARTYVNTIGVCLDLLRK